MQIPKKSHADAELASTDCSPSPLADSPPAPHKLSKKEEKGPNSKEKKRVGRYCYYLKDLIGSGYEGKVYKGTRDGDKNTLFAIKVIKTKNMKAAATLLLSNQVALLQELDHPNVVRLVQILYSANHCYIITEYCEGGSLEHYYRSTVELEWGTIVHQISEGCQYLSSKNIIHRDLKPDNIFLKEGVWKIGDFGFARKLEKNDMLLIESYRVGSPLYMPLQTLARNMYSIKSDSFSLGVIIYNLIFREFPFKGRDIDSLIKCQENGVLKSPEKQSVSSQILEIIKGLCHPDHKNRLAIADVDFGVFFRHKTIAEIDLKLAEGMKGRVPQQVILCQFINYFMRNSMYFLEEDHQLYSLMSNQLYHLTEVFGWSRYGFLSSMKENYILPYGSIKIDQQLYDKILTMLQNEINILRKKEQTLFIQAAILKIGEYYQFTECILQGQIERLLNILGSIELHQSFNEVTVTQDKVEEVLTMFDLH